MDYCTIINGKKISPYYGCNEKTSFWTRIVILCKNIFKTCSGTTILIEEKSCDKQGEKQQDLLLY
jgi:hypothetical protein